MLQYSKRAFILTGITLGLLVAAPTVADQTKSAQAPVAGSPYSHPASTRGFNPQPEPPARLRTDSTQTESSQFESPGSIRGFNPQPEPPGKLRGFNPQPEPPPQQHTWR